MPRLLPPWRASHRLLLLTIGLALAGCSVGAPGSASPTVDASAPVPESARPPAATGSSSAAPSGSPASPEPSPECEPPADPFGSPEEEAEDGETATSDPPEPFYEEGDIEALQGYAEEHPDSLGGIWIDWETETIALSFTSDLDRHERGAREAAPDAPIRIVEARYTKVEMLELMDRVFASESFNRSIRFEPQVAGYDEMRNIVTTSGLACRPDEAAAALKERYGADRIEPTVYPLPGPEPEQPQQGDGWRLIAEVAEGGGPDLYAIAYADTRQEYEAMTRELGMDESPRADLEKELVAAFYTSGGPGAGGDDAQPCGWVHFGPLEIDPERGTVVGTVRHPRPPGIGCDTVGVPFAYLIGIDRDALPERPFVLRKLEPGCQGCTKGIEVR
jgi:hypothetical protein